MAADVRGINTAKIPAMKNAIETWAKAVDAAKITITAKKLSGAMQGMSQQQEVKKLCQAVDSYTNTLTKKLREYEQRLDDVKTAYAKNDQSSAKISEYTSKVKQMKS